jgi:hypothetical protein
LNIVPAERCTDEEFLRRVTIDTIGAIPEPEELIRFCADTSPAKRERKIEELLAHPMHAALWATRMCDMTKCDVRSMGDDELLAARRAQMWHDWFRKRFSDNTSYAEIVRGVVTATSREDLAVSDWMQREEELIQKSRESFAGNYADRDSLDLYWRRVNSDAQAQLKANAELTAVAFTGVRLNCAQCHKHPFDRWTQDDYAAFANIFSRVIYGTSTETNAAILEELARRRELKKTDKSTRPLPRIREVFTSNELGQALNGSVPGAVSPRALTGPEFDQEKDLRRQFYDWLVSPENAYFAPSFVNRAWAAYFGIGLVDPVDDFSVTNPPSHPELLSELARSFRESGFDIRRLEKQILMSAAYQRSAAPNESNRNDRRNFSRQHVRPLMAEVALDAINKALGTSEDFGDFAREGSLAIEVGTNELSGHAGHAFNVLGRGKRESTCDCDRRTESDLRQVVFLINDRSIFTKMKTGSIRELLKCDDRELVEQLYLRMLGRKPDPAEIQVGVEHLRNAMGRELAFDDLVWGLLNTREFITNH